MQRRAMGPVLGVLMIGVLAGCATGAGGTDPAVSAPSASAMASASTEGDAEAEADLIVTNPFGNPTNRVVHNATVPNAPTQESLEGIIYTIAEAKDGVAVRALIGVIPSSAVCPTPEPGTSLGGPGQG